MPNHIYDNLPSLKFDRNYLLSSPETGLICPPFEYLSWVYDMLYSHTLPAHVIGCYDCTQPGFEDWFSTHAQSLILTLFPVMIEDNSDQTSNLVSYRLIFKLLCII